MMKRLVWFAASLLMISSASLVLAQDSAPAPAENHSWKNVSPEMKAIHDRIKLQENLIAKDVQNKSLAVDEATTLNAKLKSIREEIRADFKQNKENGQEGLTDGQINQINSELDANSTAIPGASAAATPAN